MLESSTLKFLKDLKKNNNKPWFDANRKQYENAKANFILLVDDIIKGIGKFDNAIGLLEARKCIFRINRDVRFSKDKSPYKNNMGGYFSANGKKANEAGYYFHVEPGQSFIAGGFYVPDAPVLAKIRQEIDYNFEEWKVIVNNKILKKNFEKGVEGIETLSRHPKGYDENNPAIEYLKMKSFIVTRPVSDTELQQKNIVKELSKYYQAMKPLVDFLNRSID